MLCEKRSLLQRKQTPEIRRRSRPTMLAECPGVCEITARRNGAPDHSGREDPGRETLLSRLDRSLIAGLLQFQGLEPVDLDHVLEHARSQRVAKDAAIFGQGGEADSFFLLLDGYVRVVKVTPDGQQVIVRYISAHGWELWRLPFDGGGRVARRRGIRHSPRRLCCRISDVGRASGSVRAGSVRGNAAISSRFPERYNTRP